MKKIYTGYKDIAQVSLIFILTVFCIVYPVLFKKKGKFALLGMSVDGQVPLSITPPWLIRNINNQS